MEANLTGKSGQQPQLNNTLFGLPMMDEEPSCIQWATTDDLYQPMDCTKNRSLDDTFGGEADLYGLVSNILEDADQVDSNFAEIINNIQPTQTGWISGRSPQVRHGSLEQCIHPDFQMQSDTSRMFPDVQGKALRQLAITEPQQRADYMQCLSYIKPPDGSWSLSPHSREAEFSCLPSPPGREKAPHAIMYDNKCNASKLEYCTSLKDNDICMVSEALGSLASYLDHVPGPLGGARPERLSFLPEQELNRQAASVQEFLQGNQDMYLCDPPDSRAQSLRCGGEPSSFRLSSGSTLFPPSRPHRELCRRDLNRDFDELCGKELDKKGDFISGLDQQCGDTQTFYSPSCNMPVAHLINLIAQKGSEGRAVHSPLNQFGSDPSQFQSRQTTKAGVTGLGSRFTSPSGPDVSLPLYSQQMQRCPTSQENMGGCFHSLRKEVQGVNMDKDFSDRRSMASNMSTQQEPVREQGLLQNPYLEFLCRMYGPQVHQLNIGGNTSKLQSSPPFLLFQCPASGDSRQKGFTTFPYSHKPPLNISNSVSDRDFSNFNTYLQDGSTPGFESPLRSPRLVKSQGAATNQLHQHLEDCCKQLKLLEKERKKAEEILNISCLPKGTLLAGSSPLPKIPPNPSRVDRLIVDQLREQSRVASLLGRMECLCGFPLHANIFSKLLNHQEAIHVTQAGRRMELIANRQGGAILRENKDVMQLAVALRDLCVVTRKCCLALWCALQVTLPMESQPREEDGPEQPSLDMARASGPIFQ